MDRSLEALLMLRDALGGLGGGFGGLRRGGVALL